MAASAGARPRARPRPLVAVHRRPQRGRRRAARSAALPRRERSDVVTLDCTDATVSLGAYVIGALDHTERAELEAHLARCPMCRDDLAELAPLPGLLSRLTLDEALAAPL